MKKNIIGVIIATVLVMCVSLFTGCSSDANEMLGMPFPTKENNSEENQAQSVSLPDAEIQSAENTAVSQSSEGSASKIEGLIKQYYSENVTTGLSVPNRFSVNTSSYVTDDWVNYSISDYGMSSNGAYISIDGCNSSDEVFFEMADGTVVMAEHGIGIADYSYIYPSLFTFRSSDCSVAAYAFLSDPNISVIRIWIYNWDDNAYQSVWSI